MRDELFTPKKHPDDVVVALVGCPNVGKSTLFNALTGLKQHTGNWPGKTVAVAQGQYRYKGKTYILVDLPGTYSLVSQSKEEQIAVDFITSGLADCTLVVADATCLERTILPALQVMELTDRIAVSVNLMDEAERKEIDVDLTVLSRELGVPAIWTAAGSGKGLDQIKETIRNLSDGFLPVHPRRVCHRYGADLFDWKQEHADHISKVFSERAEEIADAVVSGAEEKRGRSADRYVLGRRSGPLIMLLILICIFWLTMKGSNIPSAFLQKVFDRGKIMLDHAAFGWPNWLRGILLDGVFQTVGCVISVMLPPLLIFFPLFSFLEDLGYLPRAAFLLDHTFETCGSCGKQALTMAMGFGCNAVGVTGSRIISSEKERLLAILTNSLIPCNGRFPAMILLIRMFFSQRELIGALLLTGMVLLGIGATLLASKIISNSLLRTESSHMILELPPYRRPNFRKIIKQALLDHVWSVLRRAVLVSIPAGAVIWLLQQLKINDASLLVHISACLDPLGTFLGMNGIILTAFILAFPANELLIPSILMMMGNASLANSDPYVLSVFLVENGWTIQTALCTMIFLLFHWPCGTTCLTIRNETGSWKWTVVSILLPLLFGLFLCGMIGRI